MQTAADHEHLSSYFRSFVRADADLVCQVALVTEPAGAGFVASVMDPSVEKLVLTRNRDRIWSLYDRFTSRSNRRSPLPPFHMAEIQQRLGVLHGAALVTPTGRAVVLCGRSLSGKSAVSLAMLEQGWAMLSDDLAVIRLADEAALRFDRPIGIRPNTLRLLPWLGERLARGSGRLVAADAWTGTTITVHVDDIYPGRNTSAEADLDAIYVLERDQGRLTTERMDQDGARKALERHDALGSGDWARVLDGGSAGVYRTSFLLERDVAQLAEQLLVQEP